MATFDKYQLTEGDIGTNIDLTCKDENKVVIDISSATVVYRWKHKGIAAVTKTAAVQDGPNGIVRYTTLVNDIQTGDLEIQVQVTIGTDVWNADPVLFRVGPKLT